MRLFLCLVALASTAHAAGELRVCADPDNLPFSNDRGEGFENKIAAELAGALGRTVAYAYRPQQRGFFRETLKAGVCDVVIGVPPQLELVLATRPFARSSYVFVTRKDRRLDLRSLDDPRLRELTLAVQLVGDDGANTPPAHLLAARGLVANVRGYHVNSGDAILDAVARGDVDVALVWGPRAGWMARRRGDLALAVIPTPADAGPYQLSYEMAVGVRRSDRALRDELEAALRRRSRQIARILDAYGVPR
jgi:mxaJ protein